MIQHYFQIFNYSLLFCIKECSDKYQTPSFKKFVNKFCLKEKIIESSPNITLFHFKQILFLYKFSFFLNFPLIVNIHLVFKSSTSFYINNVFPLETFMKKKTHPSPLMGPGLKLNLLQHRGYFFVYTFQVSLRKNKRVLKNVNIT